MKSHNYLSVAIKHLVQLFSRQSVSTTHTLPKIIRKIEVPIPIPLRVPHVFKTWLQAAAINLPKMPFLFPAKRLKTYFLKSNSI